MEERLLVGANMIDIFNSIGVNGNHEFDDSITCESMLDRIDESNFTWVSLNVFDAKNKSRLFASNVHSNKVKPYEIHHFGHNHSTSISIGFTGITIDKYDGEYVYISSNENIILQQIKELQEFHHVDMTIVLSHDTLEENIYNANLLSSPGLKHNVIILGGHDHDNDIRFTNTIPITISDMLMICSCGI